MTTIQTWVRMVSTVALLVLFAAACASDTTGTAETETEPTETATETAATPTDTETAATEPGGTAAAGDGLVMGRVLPETGRLAFLGPPMIAAYDLAVADANDAGGVNGAEVESLGGDEGDGDGTIANTTVDRLLADGAQAIVGAAASGISLSIIDKVTGAGVVQCSPSNTSPTFTDYADDGLYFRAAPTDVLQGPVLAEQIVSDGATNVALLARSDDYGQGLLDATATALEAAGATVVVQETFDQDAPNFDAEVQSIVNADPPADAAVVIAFEEGAQILATMIERGVGPSDILVYGADGLRDSNLGSLVNPDNPGVLAGMRGTAPASSSDQEFLDRLQEANPELEDTLFAGESYDCATIVMLAAQQGGANDGATIAENMISVTKDGTTCTSFAECSDLLADGEDIDYDGVSGPLEFTEAGEPNQGRYEIWEVDAEGMITTLDEVTSTLG